MADPSTCPPLTRASVFQARELIRPHVHLTPVVTSATLTRLASTWRKEGDQDQDQDQDQDGTSGSGSGSGEREGPAIRLWFKCENLQRVGAFKVRGAFHAVERLKGDRAWVEGGGLERGVATHSSGEFFLRKFLFVVFTLPFSSFLCGCKANLSSLRSPPRWRRYGSALWIWGLCVERERLAGYVCGIGCGSTCSARLDDGHAYSLLALAFILVPR